MNPNVSQHYRSSTAKDLHDARYYASLSEAWANEDENVVILGRGYSSRHYAIKAAKEADVLVNMKAKANTLSGGSEATATWDRANKTMIFGIPKGIDGKDGENGVDGKDGKDGINGTDGKDGTNGVDGTDGTNGVDGVDGKDADVTKDIIAGTNILIDNNGDGTITINSIAEGGDVPDTGGGEGYDPTTMLLIGRYIVAETGTGSPADGEAWLNSWSPPYTWTFSKKDLDGNDGTKIVKYLMQGIEDEWKVCIVDTPYEVSNRFQATICDVWSPNSFSITGGNAYVMAGNEIRVYMMYSGKASEAHPFFFGAYSSWNHGDGEGEMEDDVITISLTNEGGVNIQQDLEALVKPGWGITVMTTDSDGEKDEIFNTSVKEIIIDSAWGEAYITMSETPSSDFSRASYFKLWMTPPESSGGGGSIELPPMEEDVSYVMINNKLAPMPEKTSPNYLGVFRYSANANPDNLADGMFTASYDGGSVMPTLSEITGAVFSTKNKSGFPSMFSFYESLGSDYYIRFSKVGMFNGMGQPIDATLEDVDTIRNKWVFSAEKYSGVWQDETSLLKHNTDYDVFIFPRQVGGKLPNDTYTLNVETGDTILGEFVGMFAGGFGSVTPDKYGASTSSFYMLGYRKQDGSFRVKGKNASYYNGAKRIIVTIGGNKVRLDWDPYNDLYISYSNSAEVIGKYLQSHPGENVVYIEPDF